MMNYKINNEFVNLTLNDFLKEYHLGNSQIYKLFLNSAIKVNGQDKTKDYKLQLGDLITIIQQENDITPYNYQLSIIYEDDYLLIIDKPYGYTIHGEFNSCDNMVAAYYLSKGLNIKVRHVHRLDKETTGILIYAKDILTETYFNYHLDKHDFIRLYLAKVQGEVKTAGVIEKNIGKNRHKNNEYIITKNGKYAKTYYQVLSKNKKESLLLVKLETGRTHQIRVHLKSIGHPLINDPIYNPGLGKMYLRSYKFTFVHPFTKKTINIEAKYAK